MTADRLASTINERYTIEMSKEHMVSAPEWGAEGVLVTDHQIG